MKNKILLKQLLLIFLIMFALSSCGFSLRGVYNIPAKYKIINLQGYKNMDDNFKKSLLTAFKNAAINIKTDDDIPTINIQKIIRKKIIQSLKTNGTVNKYHLSVEVVYRIDKNKYTALSSGILNFDENNIHSTNTEQETIYQELNQKTIGFIMLKLQSMSTR
jgi:outer membrane lipopolysaccharide assembly protein LptE/RlpB